MIISKIGFNCTIVTLEASAIGRMSCNPAIGGLAKGHLVKEIDALGGIMGKIADQSTIQNKILNMCIYNKKDFIFAAAKRFIV